MIFQSGFCHWSLFVLLFCTREDEGEGFLRFLTLARGASGIEEISRIKLSVGVTCHAYLLEIEGLFTQGSRPGRTVGEWVGGIIEMDSSDWSNGIRYHTFETRSDTEFKQSMR